MLTLTVNDLVLSPAPDLEVRLASVSPEDGGGVRETWLLKGTLSESSPDALVAKRAVLEAALHSDQLTLAYANDGTALRTLSHESTVVPPTCEELRFDATDPARLNATVRYTVRVVAVNPAPTEPPAVQLITQRITHGHTVGGPLTIRVDGSARIAPGTSEEAAVAALSPASRPGMRRTESKVALRADNNADFLFVDTEILRPLPTGVTDGHYSTSTIRDRDGRQRRIIEGHFAGPLAERRAEDLRPAQALLVAATVSQNPFTGVVNFRYETLLDTSDSPLRAATERITITEKRRIIEHPLLAPGVPAHRQEIGQPAIEVAQEGEATGQLRHPTPAPPLYPADVIEREVTYSPLTNAGPRRAPPTTRWRYVMRPPQLTSMDPPTI